MCDWKHLKLGLCGVLAALILSSCGSPSGTRPSFPKLGNIAGAVTDLFSSNPLHESNPTAERLYQAGIEFFKKGRYARSISFFQRLRDDFPFSKQAEAAELKIADAYHLNGEYAEAAETYSNYLTFQPTGQHTHFVKYKLGQINLDQFNGIDRDLEKVRAAKRYFESVIKDHPESEHVPNARNKRAKALIHLAERELYVGKFYLKAERYRPARERFENILRDYPDTPVVDRARTELSRIPATAQDSTGGLLTSQSSNDSSMKSVQAEAKGTPGASRFITKEGYVDEDPEPKLWYGYLNPLAWVKDEEQLEGEAVASRQNNGKTATEEPSVTTKLTTFFSTLNPFSPSEQNKAESPKGPNPAETMSAKKVIKDIDKTLRVPASLGNEAPTSPVADLPQEGKPDRPIKDPTKVLGDIDSKLSRKTLLRDLPRPPASDSALFSVKKAEDTDGKSTIGGDQSELLEGIDKQLQRDGINNPQGFSVPPARQP